MHFLLKIFIQSIFFGVFIFNTLYAQIPKNTPASDFERLLNKNLRYPEEFVDSISGYVVFKMQEEASGIIVPDLKYSSNISFSDEVISTLQKITPGNQDILKSVVGKLIAIDFTTYTYPDHKKIDHSGEKAFTKPMEADKIAITVKIESWTSCKKYSSAISTENQTPKTEFKKPESQKPE